MKTKSIIKTKSGQQDVVSKIESEVRLALGWLPTIEIKDFEAENVIGINVSNGCMLSSAVLEDLFKITQSYLKMYPSNIGYYITTESYYSQRSKAVLHRAVFYLFVEIAE